jgi:hypothetical protein
MVLHPGQLSFGSQHPSAPLPPEALMQIVSARVHLDLEQSSRMEALLRGGLNWADIMTESRRLGTLPLLYKHLSQPGFSRHVPEEVRTALKEEYRNQAMRNLRIYGLIERLLSSFEEAHIAVVLLKGAFLARWVYQDIALRPMGDIDILCREEQESLVRTQLAELGLHHETVYPSLFHERFFAVNKGGHINPFYGSRPLMVEVHFSIFPNVPQAFMHMPRVWDRIGLQPAEGMYPSCLAPDDLVLYLCLHLMQHLRFGQCMLYWFCDICEAIAHYRDQLEWERLFLTAESLAVVDQVQPILRLLSRHWQSRVPEMHGEVEELSLATILRKQVLMDHEEKQRAIIRGQFKKLGMVQEIRGWPNRLYFLWKLVFPSRENLISRYGLRHPVMLTLSCLVHPLVLAKRAVVSLFHHIFTSYRTR